MNIRIEEVKTKNPSGLTEIKFVILCGKKGSLEVKKYENTLAITDDMVTMAENPQFIIAKLKKENAQSVFNMFYHDTFLAL